MEFVIAGAPDVVAAAVDAALARPSAVAERGSAVKSRRFINYRNQNLVSLSHPSLT